MSQILSGSAGVIVGVVLMRWKFEGLVDGISLLFGAVCAVLAALFRTNEHLRARLGK